MAIAKILKFVKDEKGIVLLYNIQKNLLIASFEPSLNIVRETGDPNRFKIASSLTPDGGQGFVLDYRTIDAALCSPVIVEANINDFLIELSRKFFFLDKTIPASSVIGLETALLGAKIYPEGTFQVFKRNGNIDNTKLETNDFVIGIVETKLIKGIYLGGVTNLLVSFNIINTIEF